MAKVTFTGVNASGYTRCWGYTFPCGGTVEVDDPEAIERAKTHPEFTVDEKSPAKAENPPAESEKAAEAPVTASKPRKRRTRRKKAA
jgi:hypothetical protein